MKKEVSESEDFGGGGFTWPPVTQRLMSLVLKQWREDKISQGWFTSYQSGSSCPLLKCPHDHLFYICYLHDTKSSTQQKIISLAVFMVGKWKTQNIWCD